jgi:hypothetical protein
MSHYPSTAELAAFRWPWRRNPVTDAMASRPTLWELRYGTVREAGQRDFDWDPANHSLARREASAMRSCASARIFGDGVTWPEVTTFAPEVPYRCINCRGIRCPEYACATYNPGEVAYIA